MFAWQTVGLGMIAMLGYPLSGKKNESVKKLQLTNLFQLIVDTF